jgi:hypothetical protein
MTEYLSINEINALLKAIDDTRDQAIVVLFLTTGLFVNELIDLKTNDINFEKKELLITGKRKREIPLTDQAFEALAKWSKERISKTPIQNFFLTSKGKVQKLSVRTIDNMLRKYAKLAGFKRKINSKILRNTFAINLFSQDISMTKASNILGITDPTSIKRYIETARKPATEKPKVADIEHTDKRPILEKGLSKIFPTTPKIVKAESQLKGKIIANPEEVIFDRDNEIKEILHDLSKGQSVLITGPSGVGLTHLEKHILKEKENLFYLKDPNPLKQTLINICDKMELDWKGNLGARASNSDILNYVLANSKTGTVPILVMDNLNKLKAGDMEIIISLLDNFTILGATNNLNTKLNKLWWKFKEIKIKPLSVEAEKKLIKYLTQNLNISDYELMETKILNLANGLPLAITDMVKRLSHSHVVNRAAVQDLYHEAGVVYRDWTPIVIVAWGAIVALRFIALGTHSFEGYIMAGLGTSTMLVVRFFMMKMR